MADDIDSVERRRYTFEAQLERWDGEGAPWVLVTLPEDISDDIDDSIPTKGGFGSVRVELTIGSSTWRTSLFPSTERGAFIVFIKKPIRKAESIDVGDRAAISVEVVTDE